MSEESQTLPEVSHEQSQPITSLAQTVASLGGCCIGVLANTSSNYCGNLFLRMNEGCRFSFCARGLLLAELYLTQQR